MTDEEPRYSLVAGTTIACRLLQIDTQSMLRVAGLSPDVAHHEEVGVTASEFYRAWDALITLAARDDVPHTLGVALARGPFIPAMFALSCAPHLEEGLARLTPYKALIGPTAWRLAHDENALCIAFESVDPSAALPASMATMQAVLVTESLRTFTGRGVVPKAVEVAGADALAEYFGVAPRAVEPARLVLRREDGRLPFISENPALWSLHQQDLNGRARRLERTLPIAQRLRGILRQLLAEGQLSLPRAAEELQMSARGLQLALQQEELTFQGLLDEVREALALRYLTMSDLRNAEIAHLLGFQDPNSFYRAFRAWTGMTPSQVRERV